MRKTAKVAYTLVEMAIVLVVIGVIMGMAVKGKALFEAAEMRSNVNKIVKAQTAVAVLLSNTLEGTLTDLPIDNTTSPHKIKNETLLQRGLLAEPDLMFGDDNLSLEFCNLSADEREYRRDTDGRDKLLCVITPDNWTHKLTCSAEVSIDDQNIRRGNGRANISEDHSSVGGTGGASDNSSGSSYRCDKAKKGKGGEYFYVILRNIGVK